MKNQPNIFEPQNNETFPPLLRHSWKQWTSHTGTATAPCGSPCGARTGYKGLTTVLATPSCVDPAHLASGAAGLGAAIWTVEQQQMDE